MATVAGVTLSGVTRVYADGTQAVSDISLEIAVDTRALHFFDGETGLGIYAGATRDSVHEL